MRWMSKSPGLMGRRLIVMRPRSWRSGRLAFVSATRYEQQRGGQDLTPAAPLPRYSLGSPCVKSPDYGEEPSAAKALRASHLTHTPAADACDLPLVYLLGQQRGA